MTSRRNTAPNSRPVHPCYMSVFDGTTGAEYSTWANITGRNGNDDGNDGDGLPDLVTAQGSTLNVYTIENKAAKFLWSYSFPNLSGNVCYLETLKAPESSGGQQHPDQLLVGFAGNPRLAIVQLKAEAPYQLLATTLLDLGPALSEYACGAITPFEQDLQADLLQSSSSGNKASATATLSIVLGGGVAVACVALHYENHVWCAMEEEPYLLPLQALSAASLFSKNSNTIPGTISSGIDPKGGGNIKNELTQSIVTGFGDILDIAFLPEYLEPTLVVLHSNPHSGLAASARLGRDCQDNGGTRFALQVTAVSVGVAHQRSAILWTAEVPADAQQLHACPQATVSSEGKKKQHHHHGGGGGCLVVCVNSILALSNTGQIDQCLAVNGWAPAGLTTSLLEKVQSNPWPFPKLAIALDGCRMYFVNESTAFLSLRGGQLYLVQKNNSLWSVLPLYSTVGAIGEVNDLKCCPLGKMTRLPSSFVDGKLLLDKKGKAVSIDEVEMGLLFVGSRLGDSSLLGFALESTSVEKAMTEDPGFKGPPIKMESSSNGGATNNWVPAQDHEYERILQLEEEALYAPEESEGGGGPNIIPPGSDDEDMMTDNSIGGAFGAGSRERKRARLSQLMVVRSLTVLDSISAFGPLGPGCNGPLSQAPEYVVTTDPTSPTKDPPLGAMGYVFPCGYGSSGGLSLLTTPGRDDRTILAEEDCINAKAIFSLPERGYVLMGMSNGGFRFMKLDPSSSNKNTEDADTSTMAEINLDEWVSDDVYGYVMSATLLAAYEWNSDIFALLVEVAGGDTKTYTFLIMNDSKETLDLQAEIVLELQDGELIQNVTPFTRLTSDDKMCFGYTVSSGDAYLAVASASGGLKEFKVEAAMTIPMEIGDKDLTEEEQFYASGAVTALDIFEAPKSLFVKARTGASPATFAASDVKTEHGTYVMDDDDAELYGESAAADISAGGNVQKVKPEAENNADKEIIFYFALCRQSGDIEVYVLSDWIEDQTIAPVWSSSGCSHGVPQLLSEKQDGPAFRPPRMHKLYTKEMRFFVCGPSSSTWANAPFGPRIFCLAVEGSNGDMFLYEAEVSNSTHCLQSFSRVPLKYSTRPSQEQSKHFLKLRRKGMLGRPDTEKEFQYPSLFRVTNISGQDGLFAAAARPVWLIADRGRPTMLCHRSRHVAPAGSRTRPISGFCSGLVVSLSCFLFLRSLLFDPILLRIFCLSSLLPRNVFRVLLGRERPSLHCMNVLGESEANG